MSDDLEDLKREYNAIAAPQHLVTRINASVADSQTRSSFWMPAAVTCTAILALIWFVPLMMQVEPGVASQPTTPSLSALAALKPTKPSLSPSMTQLRTVSIPRLPAKPKPKAPSKTQTNYQFEIEVLKEKNDAYI